MTLAELLRSACFTDPWLVCPGCSIKAPLVGAVMLALEPEQAHAIDATFHRVYRCQMPDCGKGWMINAKTGSPHLFSALTMVEVQTS